MSFSGWGSLTVLSLGLGALGIAGILFAKFAPKHPFITQNQAWLPPVSYLAIGAGGTSTLFAISRIFSTYRTFSKKQESNKNSESHEDPVNPNEGQGNDVDQDNNVDQNNGGNGQQVLNHHPDDNNQVDQVLNNGGDNQVPSSIAGDSLVNGLFQNAEELLDPIINPIINSKDVGLSDDEETAATQAKNQIKGILKENRLFARGREYVRSIFSDLIPGLGWFSGSIVFNVARCVKDLSRGSEAIQAHLEKYEESETFEDMAQQVRDDPKFPLGQRPMMWLLHLLGAMQRKAARVRPQKLQKDEKVKMLNAQKKIPEVSQEENNIIILENNNNDEGEIDENHEAQKPQGKPFVNPLYTAIDQTIEPLLGSVGQQVSRLVDAGMLDILDMLCGRKIASASEGNLMDQAKDWIRNKAMHAALAIVRGAPKKVIKWVVPKLHDHVKALSKEHDRASPTEQVKRQMHGYIEKHLVEWFLKDRHQAEAQPNGEQNKTFEEFVKDKASSKKADQKQLRASAMQSYGVNPSAFEQLLEDAEEKAWARYTQTASNRISHNDDVDLAIDESLDTHLEIFQQLVVEELFKNFHTIIPKGKGKSHPVVSNKLEGNIACREACEKVQQEFREVKLDFCSNTTRQQRKEGKDTQQGIQNQITECQARKQQTDASISTLEKQLEDNKREFRDQLSHLQQQRQELEHEKAKLDSQLNAFKLQSKKAVKLSSKGEKSVKKKEAVILSINAEIIELNKGISSCKHDLNEKTNELKALNIKLEQCENTFLEKSNEKVRLEVSKSQLLEAVSQEVALVKKELDDLGPYISKIESEMVSLNEKIEQSQDEITLKEKEKLKLEQSVIFHKLSKYDRESYKKIIRNDIPAVITKLEANQQAIQKLEQEGEIRSRQDSELEQQLRDCKQASERLGSQIARLQRQLANQQRSNEEVAASVDTFAGLCAAWRQKAELLKLLDDLIEPTVTLVVMVLSSIMKQDKKREEYQAALQKVVDGAFEAEADPKLALEGVLTLFECLLRDLEEPLTEAREAIGALIQTFVGQDPSIDNILD